MGRADQESSLRALRQKRQIRFDWRSEASSGYAARERFPTDPCLKKLELLCDPLGGAENRQCRPREAPSFMSAQTSPIPKSPPSYLTPSQFF
jgi:hypothetical protein